MEGIYYLCNVKFNLRLKEVAVTGGIFYAST